MVLRALFWKTTPQPPDGSLPLLIASSLAALLAGMAYDFVMAGPQSSFRFYGINAALAALLVMLAIAPLFVRAGVRLAFACAVMQVTAIWSAGAALAMVGVSYLTAGFAKPQPWILTATTVSYFLMSFAWWVGAILAVQRSLEPGRHYAVLRTVGMWVCVVAAISLLPLQPTFRGPDFDITTANYWEMFANRGQSSDKEPPAPRVASRAAVEIAQPALLDEQIAALKPHTKGLADIYAIGMAGWSDQELFAKELNGGLDVLARIFPIDGHIVRLINNVGTADKTPAASRQNFAAAVRSVGQVMDKNEDVLMLLMTSHGSKDGVSLMLRGAFYSDMAPEHVAAVLNREGIRNRILIVSACYAGVFLEPLKDDRTIVITAADADNPSFGCSDERDWTYFGDALFNHGLAPARTLEEAFAAAKAKIIEWERRDNLPASNPQAHFGAELIAKLAPLYSAARSANARASAR